MTGPFNSYSQLGRGLFLISAIACHGETIDEEADMGKLPQIDACTHRRCGPTFHLVLFDC